MSAPSTQPPVPDLSDRSAVDRIKISIMEEINAAVARTYGTHWRAHEALGMEFKSLQRVRAYQCEDVSINWLVDLAAKFGMNIVLMAVKEKPQIKEAIAPPA